VDERKSWRRLIGVYAGVVALIGTGTFFVVRGASHGEVVILANVASTPTPTIAEVYRGIQSDAGTPRIYAKGAPKVAQLPSPTPEPSPSPSPSASEKPKPAAIPARLAKAVATLAKYHAQAPHEEDAAFAASELVESQTGAHTAHAAQPAEIAQAAPLSEQAASAPTQAPAAPAPPPAQAAQHEEDNVPIYAPERIVDAQVRVAAQPDFPDGARERGEHGTSIVLVTIDPKGNVVSAAVGASSGFPTLDRAAIAAARASQFVAPKINGRPATETYRLVYDFTP
jgi:protein TonB